MRKKIFTLFALLCCVIGMQAETSYELSPGTYQSTTTIDGSYQYNFKSGGKDFIITCGKDWATGSSTTAGTIKFSRNHDYVVGLPDGVSIDAIRIVGWSNADSGDKATVKINGVDDTNELPYKTESTPGDFTIEQSTPITGSFTLRFNNAQGCVKVYLISNEGGDEPDDPAVEPNATATYALAVGETHTAGEEVSVTDAAGKEIATLTFGVAGEADYKAAKADGAINGFVAYTEGNGANGKLDGTGTQYIIKPLYDGNVEVGVVLNATKAFYVIEDGTPLADYSGITTTEKYYGTYQFDVKAGCTYIVLCTGSKLGFYGFNYNYYDPDAAPVVTIAAPTFEINGTTYESGATVTDFHTGDHVTINVEEGMYIYTNWSGKTGKTKADVYKSSNTPKGQTSYVASTSTGGQRVLSVVAGDTEDASGNSSDLAYIIFEDVAPTAPAYSIEEGVVEAGTEVTISTNCADDIIYYTIDGTDPTKDNALQAVGTATVLINETTTITAFATDKTDAAQGGYSTITYTVEPLAEPLELEINEYGVTSFYDSQTSYTFPSSVTVSVVESVTGSSLVLAPIEGFIPAGCAVIIEGEANTTAELIPTPESATATVNLLRGFDEAGTTVGDDPAANYKFYALSVKNGVVGFYWLADEGGAFTSAAHKAYLALEVDESTPSTNAFFFDTVNGITQATVSDNSNNIRYNLAGQRVDASYKGVVISNGKKMINK